MEFTHTTNENFGSFRVAIAQEIVGELTYFLEDGEAVIIIDHTWIEPTHRGKGIGDLLVIKAIDYARENQLKINPTCSFVVRFFGKHPEYSDLLD